MIVLADKIDAESRLIDLSLTTRIILDAITMASNARSETSPLSPATASGTHFFNMLVASLRGQLVPQLWSFSNLDNFSITISPCKKFQLACSRGSTGTGISDGKIPTTRSAKGPNTISAICVNQQMGQNLFPGLIPPPEQCLIQERITWWLLYNYSNNAILSELSLPVSYSDKDGRPDGWRERIILPPVILDDTFDGDSNDGGMVIDIPVTLK